MKNFKKRRGLTAFLRLENLEDRRLLATITPISTSPANFVGGIDGAGDLASLLSDAQINGRNSDGSLEIGVFPAGGDLASITDTAGNNHSSPKISEDGQTIVFSSNADFVSGRNTDGNTEIFLIDLNASNITQLTNTTAGNSLFPDVSADGQRIIFESNADVPGAVNADGNLELYLIDLDTQTIRQLTGTTTGNNTHATMASQGGHVAFLSDANLAGVNNPN